jgi:hypothetical protein
MFVFCRECGARLSPAEIGSDRHECKLEQLVEFQTQCARVEIEHGLEAQVAAWEREPRLARRLAFARYVRLHCEAPLDEAYRDAA